MNKIQIIGRLTADPELRSTGSGVQVCSFTVAVNRRFNRDETDFFPVTVWRDAAVNCNKFLAKGSQVGVCGSLQIRRYDDKDGIKRTAVDLQADEVCQQEMKLLQLKVRQTAALLTSWNLLTTAICHFNLSCHKSF